MGGAVVSGVSDSVSEAEALMLCASSVLLQLTSTGAHRKLGEQPRSRAGWVLGRST